MYRFVTGNRKKAAEISRILGVPVKAVDLPTLFEIQPERGYAHMASGDWDLAAREVVDRKAIAAEELLGEPGIVEDTGLYIPACQGLPGPLVKGFVSQKLQHMLCREAHLSGDIRIFATCHFAVSIQAQVHVRSAIVEGTIPSEPRGGDRFGWDSMFIPQGRSLTYAEMSEEEKDQCSHRSLALRELKTRPFDMRDA